MSEISIIPETQEKESVTTKDPDNTQNNSGINESQDFHLIAEDETQVDGADGEVNAGVGEEHEAVKMPAEARDSDKAVIEPESPTDEDEDVVQCTPTEEIVSPRRRGLGVGQKRKAEEENDQGGKFQRTSSREDALDSVRKKLDVIEDSQETEAAPEPSIINSASPAAPPADPEPQSPPKKPTEASKDAEEPKKDEMEVEESSEAKSTSPSKPSPPEAPKMESEPLPAPQDPPKTLPTSKKSRMSIEVIYDKALAPQKPKELVEIDEDGEKIVLDASQEDTIPIDTSYKTCESKTSDSYASLQSAKDSDEGSSLTNGNDLKTPESSTASSSGPEASKTTSATSKPELLNLVSDSEGDSISEDKPKPKILPIEKELAFVVKVKCLLQVNESSKEITGKEFLSVDFDHVPELHLSRRRNSDASALADVSDNKDATSPGSVTSNPQTYTLNPRLSILSSASTSSSSSSGSTKTVKDSHFSLPRGIPKHAKRLENIEEGGDKLKKEWKNAHLLTSSVLNFVNAEVMASDLHNGTTEENLVRLTSSTPESQAPATPKSSKKGRIPKRSRQNSRSSRTNGVSKLSPTLIEAKSETEADDSIPPELSTPSRQSARSLSILRGQTPVYDPSDALVGKECFAKWSDNNYYPGKVISKSKGKFKVSFLDGKNKVLIEEFVIPMLKTLPEGLSVYATTPGDEYGSCGIITAVEKVKEDVLYSVETDDGEKIKVSIKDIFMTNDQAQFLREIVDTEVKSPPTTPSLGKITMDNILEGSRRTKSGLGTPKSGRSKGRTSKSDVEPSGSGILAKLKKDESASDSNYSVEGSEVEGVQMEMLETPDLGVKGPANRVKGKGRNRKKSEDAAIVGTLGPIPDAGASFFKGIGFVLTCAPLESLDRYKMEKAGSANSETETENEAEWSRIAFVRERLTAQILAAGGTVYEDFEEIPEEEYGDTKLVTNVPNITAKSLLCLSVGIPPVNHRWIIRCCQENKLINASEESLPAGWSFDREGYVDMFQRPNAKPLGHAVIVMPKTPSNERSIKFWQRVIVNAGGACKVIEHQSESFMEATVVLTSVKCPSWMKEKAANWKIPLVSTTWLIQSLIEGKMMPYDAHPLYQHNPPKRD